MRILSQKGTTDLPYEKVGVSINAHDNQEIIAYEIEVNEDNYWTMARYSTAEKAEKAMEMLRKAYSPILVIDNVSDEHIKADIKPFITPIRAGKPNVEVLYNFYFQFPADSEIEV